MGLFLKLFQEVLLFWIPVRGPWWVPRPLGIKVWRQVSQLHDSSFIIWNWCNAVKLEMDMETFAKFLSYLWGGKKTPGVCGHMSKQRSCCWGGSGQNALGRSCSPRSESRALFGVGLEHYFCFLPSRGRRLVTILSWNGCSPFVELYFMLVWRLAESTLHFYILIFFFLFFCSMDWHRYLMGLILFSLAGW